MFKQQASPKHVASLFSYIPASGRNGPKIFPLFCHLQFCLRFSPFPICFSNVSQKLTNIRERREREILCSKIIRVSSPLLLSPHKFERTSRKYLSVATFVYNCFSDFVTEIWFYFCVKFKFTVYAINCQSWNENFRVKMWQWKGTERIRKFRFCDAHFVSVFFFRVES